MTRQYIEEYYKIRKDYKNPFSKELITSIKEDIFLPQFDINKNFFQFLEEPRKKIIDYCVYRFIEEFYNYKEIEIDISEYISYKYGIFIDCLKSFLSSNKVFSLEKWLISIFKTEWINFKETWEKYKDNKIEEAEILKIAFEYFTYKNPRKESYKSNIHQYNYNIEKGEGNIII